LQAAPADMSVVICAYTEDRWNELLASVESVQKQSVEAAEIIVVVDHNPALLERARVELPPVVVVENREPQGLGGARNSGIAAARGSVIAFLDDDAVASPNWLAEFAKEYEDDDVLGVGGAIEPVWLEGRPRWFPDEFGWVVGCTYRGMPESPARVRNLIGCNMSYRRRVFEVLGGFRLGYGCDETEFCIRVGRRWPGKTLLYVPAAKVLHQVPPGRARWAHFSSRCYFEGGSKAVVSWLLGAQKGLESERAYTLRTLPAGVLRGFSDALLRHDPAGVARAGAIVAGLAITTAGYARGKLSVVSAARRRGWDDGPGEPPFAEHPSDTHRQSHEHRDSAHA
jgi:GT2 family glycosyltransferase